MRWLRLNCILLASFAILSATKAESSRNKRDLSFVKNLIKTAIFGRENKTNPPLVLVNKGENYKIFRIPGFNNVLVKAVPKVTAAVGDAEKVELVSPDSKVDIVASYLGTKTQDETLNALQGVKTLLGSGVLTATKDQAVPVGPFPSHLELIAVGEGIFEKPHILLDTSNVCDDVQADENPAVVQQPTIWQGHPFLSIFQRPISFPTIFKPIGPVKVPIPVPLPTRYSYKQLHGDGQVTTYTANDDQNVIVTQSGQPDPLPPVFTYRIQEVMNLGAHGMQGLATTPIFAGTIQRPSVQYYTSPKVNSYRPAVSLEGNNYSYKQIHNDGTATSYSSGQKGDDVIVTEGGKVPAIPAFITDRIEKVATAANEKRPNPVVLSGFNVAQGQWYNPLVYGYQNMDNKGGVQVNVDINESQKTQQTQNQRVNTGSKGTYSYQTIHKDGSVTNYESDRTIHFNPENVGVKPISPAFNEGRLQNIAMTSGGPFSYKILHSDGSVTNYGVFRAHEKNNVGNKIMPVQNTKPEINEKHTFSSGNKKPSQPEIKYKGTAGYTYKTIHSDGSVTSYSNSGVVEENGKGPEYQMRGDDIQIANNRYLHTNNQQNAELFSDDTHNTNRQKVSRADYYSRNQHASGDSKVSERAFHQNKFHVPQIGNPSSGSYTYKAVHNDGSVTIYSQNGVKEINEQQKFSGQNKLQQSASAPDTSQKGKQTAQEKTPRNADEPLTIKNQELSDFRDFNRQENNQVHITAQNIAFPVPGSFPYKAVNTDGSTTIYSQNGVKEEKALINKNQQSSDHQEHNQQNLNGQNVVIPVPESFSYKGVHSDGSTTFYSQHGVKEENAALINENQQSPSAAGDHYHRHSQNIKLGTQDNGAADMTDQAEKQNIKVSSQHNSLPAYGSFSYKAVHSDGSTTIYSQNGVKENKAANKNQQASVFNAYDRQENNQQNVNVVQKIGIPVPESFSYKAVHDDGSMTVYSQKGVKEENTASKSKDQQSSSATGVYYQRNSQNVQPSAQKNAAANKTNLVGKQSIQVSSQRNSVPAPESFSYKAVHSDGSTTIYSKDGVKVDAPLTNKIQQFTVFNDFDCQEKNLQNVNLNTQNIVTPVPGTFSYKAVHDDGSMTVYSQNGVKEDIVSFKNKNPQSTSATDFKQRNDQNIHVSSQNVVVPDSRLFSYKTVHNDGSMTTYTKSNVKEETNAKETHIEKSHNNQPLEFMTDIKVNEQHLHTNKLSNESSFSHKSVYSDGSETKYLGQGVEKTKASSQNKHAHNVLSKQNLSQKQDGASEEMNVHTNQQYNGKPSGSFSFKTIQSDGSVSNTKIGSSQQNDENGDQSSAAFDEIKSDEQKIIQIIPPAPELPELSSNDLSATPVSVLVADSNKVLFTKPVVSSYTYKQINHNSPDQFKVAVNIGEAPSTESQFKVSAQVEGGAKINEAATVDTIPKDYVYIPPENVNEPLPIKPLDPKEESRKTTQNIPSVVVLSPVEVVPCVEKSLSEHPIVVLDEPLKYTYQQRKADGSAIHVESDQSVVSVNISPRERARSRGDIPESP